jgi:hypothetical protein
MVKIGEIYVFPCKDYCHSEIQSSLLKFECMKILVFFFKIFLLLFIAFL